MLRATATVTLMTTSLTLSAFISGFSVVGAFIFQGLMGQRCSWQVLAHIERGHATLSGPM